MSEQPDPSVVRRFWQLAVTPRLRVLRLLPLGGRALVASLTVVDLLLGLLPVAFVLAASALIGRAPAAAQDGVGSDAWDALVVAFVVAAAVFLAQQLVAPVQTALGQRLQHRVDGHFYRRIMSVAVRSTDLVVLEDPQTLDKLHEARETLELAWNTPGHAAAGMLAYLARYTRLLGFVVIVAVTTNVWAAAALLASTMCFRYGQRGSGLRVLQRLHQQLTPLRRQQHYFRDLGIEAAAGKEIRLFGLIDWVVGRFRAAATGVLEGTWSVRRVYYVNRFVWFTVIALVVDCGVLVLITRSAAAGQITLTELALGTQAAIAAILLGEMYPESDPSTQFGMSAVTAVEELEALVAVRRAEAAPDGVADAAGTPRSDIRLADLTFRYPGTSRAVLDGLDLTLRAGQCTAIVGVNGAGKTTLVKLLARLYEPTSGSILVDGRDVRDLDVDSWRRQVGVIFQDFNRYELSVTDNVALGAVERPVREEAVRAATDKAGLTATIDALPNGFDTILSPRIEGGTDLSGGQWQRLAIARALYAVDAGARLLILDEPTSALDVRSEAAFFDAFAELTRGLTTVLISHRFSSVRKADRIVVLEHGTVIEDGSHDELLAHDGRYAHLFRLQAERFSDQPTETEVEAR